MRISCLMYQKSHIASFYGFLFSHSFTRFLVSTKENSRWRRIGHFKIQQRILIQWICEEAWDSVLARWSWNSRCLATAWRTRLTVMPVKAWSHTCQSVNYWSLVHRGLCAGIECKLLNIFRAFQQNNFVPIEFNNKNWCSLVYFCFQVTSV